MLAVDVTCLVVASLFVAANVLGLVIVTTYRTRQSSSWSFDDLKNLEPAYLQEQWEFRYTHHSMELAYGIVNAIAWFGLAIPIIKVAWIQSGQGQRQLGLHVTIGALALAGSFSELLARLLFIGSINAQEWLARDFNLNNWVEAGNDQIGWRTLEMIYVATRGLLLWIDAIEFLFLAGIFWLLFVSIIRSDASSSSSSSDAAGFFGKRWAWFGAILGVLSVLDFTASILRFTNWGTFSAISLAIGILNRLILFPVWLVWLGKQLPRAEASLIVEAVKPPEEQSGTIELTESSDILT